MSRIYSRASWGAQYRDGVGTRPVGSLQKYFHHSVTRHLPANATIEQERVECRTVERIGQQRFGAGISYTFLVFPSGRIHQGASVNRISYHSGGGRDGKPRNTLGVGICLVGNTEANEMTPAQIAAVVRLLQEGVRRGWWQDPAITEGHRDFKNTSCPGRHAYALIGEINRRGRGGAVLPSPSPSKPTDRPAAPTGDLTVADAKKILDAINDLSTITLTDSQQKALASTREKWSLPQLLGVIAHRAGYAFQWSNQARQRTRDVQAQVEALTEAVMAIGEVTGMDRTQVQAIVTDTFQQAQVRLELPDTDVTDPEEA